MSRLVEELTLEIQKETITKIIKNLLLMKEVSYEEIADITEVSIEEVKEIADSLYA